MLFAQAAEQEVTLDARSWFIAFLVDCFQGTYFSVSSKRISDGALGFSVVVFSRHC